MWSRLLPTADKCPTEHTFLHFTTKINYRRRDSTDFLILVLPFNISTFNSSLDTLPSLKIQRCSNAVNARAPHSKNSQKSSLHNPAIAQKSKFGVAFAHYEGSKTAVSLKDRMCATIRPLPVACPRHHRVSATGSAAVCSVSLRDSLNTTQWLYQKSGD